MDTGGFPTKPRLDIRAVIVACVVALLLSLGIWFLKSHGLPHRGPGTQPFVPRTEQPQR